MPGRLGQQAPFSSGDGASSFWGTWLWLHPPLVTRAYKSQRRLHRWQLYLHQLPTRLRQHPQVRPLQHLRQQPHLLHLYHLLPTTYPLIFAFHKNQALRKAQLLTLNAYSWSITGVASRRMLFETKNALWTAISSKRFSSILGKARMRGPLGC